MVIKLVHPNGETKLTGNFKEQIETLDTLLEPGMPVLFKDRNINRLFFSNGEIKNYQEFSIEKGKRNYCSLLINCYDSKKYQIANHPESICSLDFPKNEDNYFFLGKAINEDFSSAINALSFARDAVYFSLPMFYSRPHYLVSDKNKNESKLDKQTSNFSCLKASMNLLEQVAKKDIEGVDKILNKKTKGTNNHFRAIQVGPVREKRQREKGVPLDSSDFIIGELGYPERVLGFVKVGKGSGWGQTYILPISEKRDALVEKAFSKENIKKFYPYGIKE